jgi:hypothetical protein
MLKKIVKLKEIEQGRHGEKRIVGRWSAGLAKNLNVTFVG